MNRFRPQLTAPLLDGWFAEESITLLAPDGQANVIASSEPLDLGVEVQQYAQVQGDLLRKKFPGYREMLFEATELLGGRRGYIRRFEWKPRDKPLVTQTQIYYVENSRGYTATATTSSTEVNRFELDLRFIIGGLLLES